jgi:hypothetical protein
VQQDDRFAAGWASFGKTDVEKAGINLLQRLK